jgi:formin 2
LLSYETLSSIYNLRPQEDELRLIQEFLRTSSEDLLDKPELFLLELSRIPTFEERIYCLVYQNKFNESISSIEFRLNNLNTISDELFNSEKIRNILGIILALGNNMNATNKSRGDADGFDLAILPNLKDVKSKDNTTNLLQYIAYFYVNKIDDDVNKFPMPDPSDFSFVSQVNFDDVEKELRRVNNELDDVESRVEVILKQISQNNESSLSFSSSTQESVDNLNSETNSQCDKLNEQFKTRVMNIIKNARDECKEQEENFTKCKSKFIKLTQVYCLKPKSSENEVTTEYFFSLWATFGQHFKDAWKRETQKLSKLRYLK